MLILFECMIMLVGYGPCTLITKRLAGVLPSFGACRYSAGRLHACCVADAW